MAKRSFYVKDSELDDYQVKVINKKTDNSYIVKGCAGSGKSILCLLYTSSLAGIFLFRHPETARLQRLQAATGLHPLQSRVDNSLPLSSDSPDLSYIIFS